MAENNDTYNVEESSKSKALPLFVFLFLASLALCAFLFFRYVKNAKSIEQKNAELTLAYKVLNIKSDSLTSELEYVNQQLQDKINENLANKDLKEDLRKKLQAKKRELSAAYRRIKRLVDNGAIESSNGANPSSLLQASSEIQTLRDQNTFYITKIEEAQRKYSEAQNTANTNAGVAEFYKVENDSLKIITSELSDKLEKAGVLRIAGFAANPVRQRKGKVEITEKASKTERLRINFSILPSEITKKEEKSIVIRVIQPNGAVLTKNTNKLTDSDDLFTLLETIDYNGSEKGVTFYYSQEADYQKGRHKVEIYHEEELLDRASFTLR